MALLENPDLRHSLARITSGMLGYMDSGAASLGIYGTPKLRLTVEHFLESPCKFCQII